MLREMIKFLYLVRGSTGKDDHVKLIHWGYVFMYSTGDDISSRPGWRGKLCREGDVEEVNSIGKLSGACRGKDQTSACRAILWGYGNDCWKISQLLLESILVLLGNISLLGMILWRFAGYRTCWEFQSPRVFSKCWFCGKDHFGFQLCHCPYDQ